MLGAGPPLTGRMLFHCWVQALVAFQHGLLLPSWAMVVGRFFAFL